MAVELDVRNSAYERFHKRMETRDRAYLVDMWGRASSGWLGWLKGAMAVRKAKQEQHARLEAGKRGEEIAKTILRALPGGWFILNGLVVEVREGEFQEIDHVVAGPPGIVVMETKAWGGVLEGNESGWRRWRGRAGWEIINLENPFAQLDRHVKVVVDLLRVSGFRVPRLWAVLVFPIAANVRYTGQLATRVVCTGAQLGSVVGSIARYAPAWTPDMARAAALVLTVQRPALRVAGDAVWNMGFVPPA